MKFSMATYFVLSLLIIAEYQCKSDKDEISLKVFCASGLVDVFTELSDSFSASRSVDVKINLASSGTLARQLAQGNKADIYISASKHWADYADSMGIFSERKQLYQNRLVFISPLESTSFKLNFSERTVPAFKGRLSIGDPGHVPAGQYARESLIYLGWWTDLEERILPAKDVRSALMPVEMGECELGIVYYTDAMASKKVKIKGVIPDSCHSPIVFEALLSNDPKSAAKEFYQLLNDSGYEKIWLKYGLTTVSQIN